MEVGLPLVVSTTLILLAVLKSYELALVGGFLNVYSMNIPWG